MKVKDLIKLLKTFPGNLEVVVNSGLATVEDDNDGLNQPHYFGAKVRKAKQKLVRKSKQGYLLIQSRPQKDSEAKLSVILE